VGRALLEIPLLWFVLPQVPIPSHGVPGGGGGVRGANGCHGLPPLCPPRSCGIEREEDLHWTCMQWDSAFSI